MSLVQKHLAKHLDGGEGGGTHSLQATGSCCAGAEWDVHLGDSVGTELGRGFTQTVKRSLLNMRS